MLKAPLMRYRRGSAWGRPWGVHGDAHVFMRFYSFQYVVTLMQSVLRRDYTGRSKLINLLIKKQIRG